MTPEIRLQSIDAEDFLDDAVSLPVFNDDEHKDDVIESSSEVLGNGNSVWEEEEE